MVDMTYTPGRNKIPVRGICTAELHLKGKTKLHSAESSQYVLFPNAKLTSS
jgi:hypothetical protein